MDKEEIIINLKLLENLKKGQKIITRDSYLNIEANSFIPECVRRWKRQDNRDETIKKINSIVNASITILNNSPTDPVKEYLQLSKAGIANLKETYSMCHQTCARLDMILDKISTHA